MRTTTLFPIAIPRFPGSGRIIEAVCASAVGRKAVVTVDGDTVHARVESMTYRGGAFEVVTVLDGAAAA